MSLIKSEDSLNEVKDVLLSTLVRAGTDRKSAFRFIILNTISNGFPNCRYVVLRKFDIQSQELFIYTDFRSSKIAEIKENPLVSVLAYDEQEHCQIKMKAKAYIHHQDETANFHWYSLQGGKESYNTENRPGKEVESLKEAHQMRTDINDDYFAVIRLEVSQAEVLQLNDKGHIRVIYDFTEDLVKYLTP